MQVAGRINLAYQAQVLAAQIVDDMELLATGTCY
jgi:hypothetical protein